MSDNDCGIVIDVTAKRISGRWQLEVSGPEWLIRDIKDELSETRCFLLYSGEGSKIVLQQKLPLLDA